MFFKLGILFAVLHMGVTHADTNGCEKLSPGEIHKVDIKKCIEVPSKSNKELFIVDSVRESGKEIKNSRAPSVEVMYRRRTSKQ